MKISKQLQAVLDRLHKTGANSSNVNIETKRELSNVIESIGLRPFNNLSCGSCFRASLYDLLRYQQKQQKKPVLQKPVSMTMDKKPNEMSYQELKKACKDKGIKAGRVSKKELIELLNKHNEN